MGLLQNGFRNIVGSFRVYGGGVLNNAYPSALHGNWHITGQMRNITAGEGITDDKVGVPAGNLHPSAWIMPQKPGLVSSRAAAITVSASAAGTMGLPAEGSATITITVPDATGQLIASGSGSASISISVLPALLTASISAAGTATISISANSPILGAEANLIGESSMSFSGSLQSYAIGHMEGTTIVESELTADAIAVAVVDAIGGDIDFMMKVLVNKREVKKVGDTWTLLVYDNDGATPIISKALKDISGGQIADLASGVLAVEEESIV